MAIALKYLRTDGSSYRVEPGEGCFFIHRRQNDAANFNIIARRLLNEPSEDYVAFARSDGFGGYDSIQIIPYADLTPGG